MAKNTKIYIFLSNCDTPCPLSKIIFTNNL